MRLPLTIFVDDDVDVKLPPPPAGNPNAVIEVMLQPNKICSITDSVTLSSQSQMTKENFHTILVLTAS